MKTRPQVNEMTVSAPVEVCYAQRLIPCYCRRCDPSTHFAADVATTDRAIAVLQTAIGKLLSHDPELPTPTSVYWINKIRRLAAIVPADHKLRYALPTLRALATALVHAEDHRNELRVAAGYPAHFWLAKSAIPDPGDIQPPSPSSTKARRDR